MKAIIFVLVVAMVIVLIFGIYQNKPKEPLPIVYIGR